MRYETSVRRDPLVHFRSITESSCRVPSPGSGAIAG